MTQYRVSGTAAHDARLVATMKIHQIQHVLTFDASDFVRYQKQENIFIIDPATL